MAAGIGLTERMRGRKAMCASTSRSAQHSREEVAWLRGGSSKTDAASERGRRRRLRPNGPAHSALHGRPTTAPAALRSATCRLRWERGQLLRWCVTAKQPAASPSTSLTNVDARRHFNQLHSRAGAALRLHNNNGSRVKRRRGGGEPLHGMPSRWQRPHHVSVFTVRHAMLNRCALTCTSRNTARSVMMSTVRPLTAARDCACGIGCRGAVRGKARQGAHTFSCLSPATHLCAEQCSPAHGMVCRPTAPRPRSSPSCTTHATCLSTRQTSFH